MNIKHRKQKLIQLTKQAEQEALIKKAAEEADLQSADSGEYSEHLFNKLLESIKIDGLED